MPNFDVISRLFVFDVGHSSLVMPIMTMSFHSLRFLRASRSCLVRLSAILRGVVFSISLVIKCMKRSSAGSLLLSGVHVLLRLNGLSSSGL